MTIARIMYPYYPGKGYINPKILLKYSKNILLTPVIIFVKWVSKNCSTNEYMNKFVQHSKRLNIKMWNWKKKCWEISKLNGYKDFLALVKIFFQVHLRNSQKNLKQNQFDDCKVKIL